MNIELLRAGFYVDALEIHPRATKKEILYRIMNLEREYSRDQEILDLLKKARDYLIRQEMKYKEWILPCLDYVSLLLKNKYGSNIQEALVNHGFLKIETIKSQFGQEQEPEKEMEDPIERVFEKLKSALQDNLSLLESSFPLNDAASKIGFVEALLELGDKDYDYLYFDGECDNSNPLRKRAVEVALEVFQNLPQESSLLGSLGFSFLKLGDYEKALKCFLYQSEKSVDDGIVLNNIAWCEMRLGNYEEALIACEKALKYLSDHSHVHHDYAAILMGLGRWHDAIKVIENAIANIKPEAIQLHYLLPSVHERKGDIQSAIFHWGKYLTLTQGKPGHQKAVFRVRNKLQANGINRFEGKSLSESGYPLRKIAKGVYNKLIGDLQEVIDIIKRISIKPHEILIAEELNSELEVVRKKEEEIEIKWRALEPECERIFEEAFRNIKSFPFVDSEKIDSLYNELINDKKSKNIPFFVLVRDVVSKLVDNVSSPFLSQMSNIILKNLKREMTVVKQEITEIENLVKEVDNLRNRLKKTEEFINEINRLGIEIKTEMLKWLASISDGFKDREKSMPGVLDILELFNEVEKLFIKGTIEKFTTGRFDYSIFWIEECLKRLEERNDQLRKEYTCREDKIQKAESHLSRVENDKITLERELTKKIQEVQQESQVISKILDLVTANENTIYLAGHLTKAGGFIGWLSGKRKKAKRVIAKLAMTCSLIDGFKPGAISKRNLSQLSINKAIEMIHSELKREFEVTKSKMEFESKILDKKRGKMIEKLNTVISNYKRSRDMLIKGRDEISREIRNVAGEKEDIERLRKECDNVRHRWPICIFQEDKDIVCASSWFFNGSEYVVYGGLKSGDLLVYDINMRTCYNLSGHKGGITSFVVNPEGNFLISTGYGGEIVMWDFEKKEILKRINTKNKILSLSLADSLLFAGGDRSIWIYELPYLTRKACLEGHEGPIVCLAVDRENAILYSGEAHSEEPLLSGIYIWDIKKLCDKNPLIRKLRGVGGWVTSLALSKDGKTLSCGEGKGDLSGPEASKIILWDTEKFRMKAILEGHKGWIESLTFSNSGKWLISGDGVGAIDNSLPSDIFMWDMSKCELKARMKAHNGWVRCLGFSKNDNFLISGGTDGLLVWDFSKIKNIC